MERRRGAPAGGPGGRGATGPYPRGGGGGKRLAMPPPPRLSPGRHRQPRLHRGRCAPPGPAAAAALPAPPPPPRPRRPRRPGSRSRPPPGRRAGGAAQSPGAGRAGKGPQPGCRCARGRRLSGGSALDPSVSALFQSPPPPLRLGYRFPRFASVVAGSPWLGEPLPACGGGSVNSVRAGAARCVPLPGRVYRWGEGLLPGGVRGLGQMLALQVCPKCREVSPPSKYRPHVVKLAFFCSFSAFRCLPSTHSRCSPCVLCADPPPPL